MQEEYSYSLATAVTHGFLPSQKLWLGLIYLAVEVVESVAEIFCIIFIKICSGFAPSLLLTLLCLQGAAGSVTLAHLEQWIVASQGSAEHLGGWHAQHCNWFWYPAPRSLYAPRNTSVYGWGKDMGNKSLNSCKRRTINNLLKISPDCCHCIPYCCKFCCSFTPLSIN